MTPFTIIIPTLNRSEFLLNTLKDLVKQIYAPGYEILIIDQSITPDQEVKRFCIGYNFIHYHYITHFRGLPEARNYGAQQAKYPYLLFLDDDIECKSNLLEEHAKVLQQENIGICAGGVTEKFQNNAGDKTGFFQKWSATPIPGFHNQANSNKFVDHGKGCNFAVKKGVYLKVSGIDEHLTKGAALYEETDFCLRVKKAGHKVYFNYSAHVMHLAAETGGCRVPEIEKYIFSLSRNRSLLIERHLPWYNKISAHFYLLKLVAAYYKSYRKPSIWRNYQSGKIEGKALGKLKVKNEQAK